MNNLSGDFVEKESYDQFLQRAMKGQLSPAEKTAVSGCERQAYIKVFGGTALGAIAARYISTTRKLGLRAIPVYFALTLGGSYLGGYFAAMKCKELLDEVRALSPQDFSDIPADAKYHNAKLDRPENGGNHSYYIPELHDHRRQSKPQRYTEDSQHDVFDRKTSDGDAADIYKKNTTYEELRKQRLQELGQSNSVPSFRT